MGVFPPIFGNTWHIWEGRQNMGHLTNPHVFQTQEPFRWEVSWTSFHCGRPTKRRLDRKKCWWNLIQAAKRETGGRKRCLKNMVVLEIDTQKTWMKFEFLKPELFYNCKDFWGAFVMVPSFFGWHMEIDPSNKELNIWLWWILEIYLQIDLPNPSQSLLVVWTLQSLPLQHSSYVIRFVVVTLRIMKMTIWWFRVSKTISYSTCV